MLVKGKDKKIATAYIKARYPIGTEIFDSVRSGSFIIKKDSVFEIHSDSDQVVEFNPKYEAYEFLVHKPGKYSPNYHIRHTPKRWVFDYYETKILNSRK
jgi:hypothetical protein